MILNGRQIPASVPYATIVSMVTNEEDVTVTYYNSPGLPTSGTLAKGEHLLVDDATVVNVALNRVQEDQ